VIEGETGYAFDCGNTDALAGLLNHYRINAADAALHGANAARHIQDYSIAKTAEGIMDALRQMLKRDSEDLAC